MSGHVYYLYIHKTAGRRGMDYLACVYCANSEFDMGQGVSYFISGVLLWELGTKDNLNCKNHFLKGTTQAGQ